MSSNMPTRKFEESVREGLENTEVSPEEFDKEEVERKKRMARAFADLDDDEDEIALEGEADEDDAPATENKPEESGA